MAGQRFIAVVACAMHYAERPKHKPPTGKKDAPSLVLRLDRAAADLNPFLLVLMIGLFILNVTLYLGMAAARQPPAAPSSAAAPTTNPAAVAAYGR